MFGGSTTSTSGNGMNGLKDRWASLEPKSKQKLMLIGVVAAVLLLAVVMLVAGGGTAPAVKRDKGANAMDSTVPSSLLPTDADSADIGNTALSKDVAGTRTDMQRLTEQVKRLEEENAQMRNANASGEMGGRDQQIMQRMEQLSTEMQDIKSRPSVQAPSSEEMSGEGMEAEAPAGGGYGSIKVIRTSGSNRSSSAPAEGGEAQGDAGVPTDGAVEGEGTKSKVMTDRRAGMYLPSGSIITGVLLTGLDAPTGKGAMKDPLPVLIRVKKEAILPSRYLADIRECFILASGSGDLPSERAYMRTESVSCTTRDKQVIDMKMAGYIVDSDGKAGLRGRLVSKQGSAMAKGIIAAFAEGVSKAFAGSDRVKFGGGEDIDFGAAGQSSAVMGASSALDRVAKYYLELADTLHPILEIDAGRPVTLILIKGQEIGTVN